MQLQGYCIDAVQSIDNTVSINAQKPMQDNVRALLGQGAIAAKPVDNKLSMSLATLAQ